MSWPGTQPDDAFQATPPPPDFTRDLRLVAFDEVAVEVGAVERTDVADQVPGGGALDLDVAARHRDVVQEDVGVGVAPSGGEHVVQGELRAGVGTAGGHQDPAGADLGEVDHDLLGAGLGVEQERDRGRLVGRPFERLAARRAEVGARDVAMAAVAAEDVGHPSISLR